MTRSQELNKLFDDEKELFDKLPPGEKYPLRTKDVEMRNRDIYEAQTLAAYYYNSDASSSQRPMKASNFKVIDHAKVRADTRVILKLSDGSRDGFYSVIYDGKFMRYTIEYFYFVREFEIDSTLFEAIENVVKRT